MPTYKCTYNSNKCSAACWRWCCMWRRKLFVCVCVGVACSAWMKCIEMKWHLALWDIAWLLNATLMVAAAAVLATFVASSVFLHFSLCALFFLFFACMCVCAFNAIGSAHSLEALLWQPSFGICPSARLHAVVLAMPSLASVAPSAAQV